MNLSGRRESSNVEDRRGRGGSKMMLGGGAGIVGVIIAIVMSLMQGNDLGSAIGEVVTDQLQNVTMQPAGNTEFTEEEQELAKFSSQILAGTEDVWTKIFEQMGRKYEAPRMVLYTGTTQSGCGQGSASMGPFYCSADQCVYIDLSFFMDMKRQLGADGDFAYAYVIAHEVGHHVQYLLGTLDKAHSQMAASSKTESNKINVRLELQADFYAGVWAYHDNQMFSSLEEGDVEEAIRCAQVIGDNYLQEKARGYSQPETFTHGTSAQRMKWLKLGITTGDINRGNTFSLPESQL